MKIKHTHEIRLDGKVVARSRNLRGILDYARKSPVESVVIAPSPCGRGTLRVTYHNNARASAVFASFTILRDWCDARRSWPKAIIASSETV